MFFFKQKTAYEMRISDWSSDVCSSDLAFGGVGPLDDFDGPFALSDLAQCLPELVTGIPTIGEDVPQPREAADYFGEDERCTVATLDVGGVDNRMNQVTVCIGQDVALAPLDFLARIVAPRPDRKSGVSGKSGTVGVNVGGRRNF